MVRLEYEEYKPTGPMQAWTIVIVTAILTLSWGMVTHMAVPEVVRHWDFGTVPDTPGISMYGTVRPILGSSAPPQIELPPNLHPSKEATNR